MISTNISQKILISVISILLFVCGSVLTYFVILLDNNTKAFNDTYTETDYAVIVPEIWDGDKTSGSFNYDNIATLINMLSNSTNGTLDTIDMNIDNASINSQGIKMITATDLRRYSEGGNVFDKSIVVTLGGYNWLVTCLSKDTRGNIVATLSKRYLCR